jgi:nitric oxide reductase subunit C
MSEFLKGSIYVGFILMFGSYTWYIYQQKNKNESGLIQHQVEAGKAIWQQKNCVACHQLYGLGGFLGPDLTNVYSTHGKGPAYIKAFVRGGTTVMPSFELDENEMDNLLAFLQHVDASGKSDPKNFRRNLDGTIESQ